MVALEEFSWSYFNNNKKRRVMRHDMASSRSTQRQSPVSNPCLADTDQRLAAPTLTDYRERQVVSKNVMWWEYIFITCFDKCYWLETIYMTPISINLSLCDPLPHLTIPLQSSWRGVVLLKMRKDSRSVFYELRCPCRHCYIEKKAIYGNLYLYFNMIIRCT